MSRIRTRLLIVDDNEDLRELYADYLTRSGYEVLEADDGQAALRVTFAERPLVIVMDLDMPVMDGWTAIRRLRADPRTKDVPIIVVSGNAMPREIREAREAGASAVLQKPCTLHAIGDVVAQALRGGSAPDEAHTAETDASSR